MWSNIMYKNRDQHSLDSLPQAMNKLSKSDIYHIMELMKIWIMEIIGINAMRKDEKN